MQTKGEEFSSSYFRFSQTLIFLNVFRLWTESGFEDTQDKIKDNCNTNWIFDPICTAWVKFITQTKNSTFYRALNLQPLQFDSIEINGVAWGHRQVTPRQLKGHANLKSNYLRDSRTESLKSQCCDLQSVKRQMWSALWSRKDRY